MGLGDHTIGGGGVGGGYRHGDTAPYIYVYILFLYIYVYIYTHSYAYKLWVTFRGHLHLTSPTYNLGAYHAGNEAATMVSSRFIKQMSERLWKGSSFGYVA